MPLGPPRLVEIPLRHPWRIARGGIVATPNVFVDLTWDGLTGHGLVAPSRRHGSRGNSPLRSQRM